jgi:hypothetical protein
MGAAFLTLWVDALSFMESFLCIFILWSVYLIISDFILFHFYKVTRAKFDTELNLVFKNFSFRNREKSFQVYDSSLSPVFMRISLLKSDKFVLNKNIANDFSMAELKAYLDLELSYSNSLGSFVEVLLQRVYLITWVPLRLTLKAIFGDVVADYLVGPLTLLYKYIIKLCRSDYKYEGKFVSILPQILFKVKILDMNQGKVSLFNISEQYAEFMISESRDQSMARFDPDELLR